MKPHLILLLLCIALTPAVSSRMKKQSLPPKELIKIKGCVKEENIDYYGYDVEWKIVNRLEECISWCGETAECAYWSFVKSDGWCYLKTSDSGRKGNSDRISGTKNCATGRSVPYRLSRFGEYCIGNFSLNNGTIIRTENSKARGAVFLNEKEVSSITQCMYKCCSTSRCNVAVFDEMDHGSCYMFDCGTAADFKCTFTGNKQFITAFLDDNRHTYETSFKQRQGTYTNERLSGRTRKNGGDIEKSQIQFTWTHTNELERLSGRTHKKGAYIFESASCGRSQFQCRNGDCIAIYDKCNGLPECDDGSDEDDVSCPSTPIPPAQSESCDRWQFQCHNGDCIAIYDVCNGMPECDDGSDEDASSCPRAANPILNFVPEIPYGNQVPNPYPYKQMLQGQIQPQYPLQQLEPKQMQKRPLKQPTKNPTVKTVTTTKTTAVTSLPVTRKYEEQLIEDLTDELVPMKTKVSATFTLVVGIIITTLLVIIVALLVFIWNTKRRETISMIFD